MNVPFQSGELARFNDAEQVSGLLGFLQTELSCPKHQSSWQNTPSLIGLAGVEIQPISNRARAPQCSLGWFRKTVS